MSWIISRHGETDLNQKGILSGQNDAAKLSLKGLFKAMTTKEIYGRRKIKLIFSSPLTRAITTVSPLADFLHLPIFLADELKEMNFGYLQGFTGLEPDIKKEIDLRKRDFSMKYPGGESYNDVIRRLFVFLEILRFSEKILSPDEDIFIQTSATTLRFLLALILKIDFSFPEKVISIKAPNSLVYEINPRTLECAWFDVFTHESGRGIRY